MTRKTLIIAIDGPSGAGKGTVSTYLANKYNLKYLDTGLLYRALAAKALDLHVAPDDGIGLENIARTVTVEDTELPNLRSEEVAAIASKVAAHPNVRLVMDKIQRDFAYSDPSPYRGVILDGRDIGTVICPDADCKIFLTACSETRAKRRSLETIHSPDATAIQKMMQERDQRDSGRKSAPLVKADDAIEIDTTHLPIDEVCTTAAYYVEKFIVTK